MNKLLVFTLIISVFACRSQKPLTQQDYENQTKRFYETIQQSEVEELLYNYASDEFMGREAGTEHEKTATEFIRNYYAENSIAPAPGSDNYYQTIPAGTYTRVNGEANNVVAYIPGTDKKDEVVVISAHLDHIGAADGKIFNGADDDGSGTVAVMNIAKAFRHAADKGFSPRRSVVFLHVTAEEKGLLGSKYYSENPLFPLKNTIANLNIDMIGRVDDEHTNKENYLYLIGSDMLSNDLKQLSERVNDQYFNFNFDYRFDAPNDPNRFYYRSDHYNFAKHNIPVIFYFNGVHADYHMETDTPDKINYPLLTKRTKLIFATAWTLASADEKPALKEQNN